MRIEKDFLGEVEIPDDAYYGIHSVRARDNFLNDSSMNPEWYKAIGVTKLAVYKTYKKFKIAVQKKYARVELPFELLEDNVIESMIESASQVAGGKWFESFIVPMIQGGAGTSINMNINEIISNVSLKGLGYKAGEYNYIDPVEHANIYQSTNDVIPTSLKVAAMKLLNDLEDVINELRKEIEELENSYRNDIRIAYTQMQQAVPSTYGILFSSYNEALSRDWWRVSKCFERIKMVNLGGSAVGTGMTIPRYIIMEVVPTLQKLTNLPVTRSENLSDTTTNLDSLVEVHAIMKAHAVNLEKMVADLRLLSSDVIQDKEVSLPNKQVGSSIMPGKVNPVIPEFVISSAHKIYSNDQLITSLSAQGCLDLNAYIPVIGNALLESLQLLIAMNGSIRKNMVAGLKIDSSKAAKKLYLSPAITTALIPFIGYHKATRLSREMQDKGVDIFEANKNQKLLDQDKLKDIIAPTNLIRMGFSLEDII